MKIYRVISLLLLALLCYSCANNTYSELRKSENRLIDSYIKRYGLRVASTMPNVPQGQYWDKDLYVTLTNYDNLYFHLNSKVDSTAAHAIILGDKVNVRFRKYTLDTYADTISYWTTDDAGEPITLTVGSTSGDYNCTGWQAAIMAMAYEGECTIICPSVYGTSADNSAVKPYCYDLRVTKKR